MFQPKTDRLIKLAEKYPAQIQELETIFDNKTNVYIDYANVIPWSRKLGWHIELKRLKQFFNSFDTVNEVKFYFGTLAGDVRSEDLIKEATELGFKVVTKPVKIMKRSIDVSSIPPNSPDLLQNFISKPLLKKLNIEAIEYLNEQLKNLNDTGLLFVEERKCNFDVEIGRDLFIDYERKVVENFVLWSGDSDFADPLKQLLTDGKKAYLFATSRRVASELSELQTSGLLIYDIQKIRNFICWLKEMTVRL